MPVPLATGGRNIRGDDSVQLLRDTLPTDEVVVRYAMPCTCVLRGLLDAMRTATDVREATVAMDMMAAAALASISRMRRFLVEHAGMKGTPQVVAALDLASEDSRSPNETRLRLIWVLDARLPTPRVNRPVFDLRGRLLGYPDLLDEEAGLVAEFDGADHRGAGRHTGDVGREDGFRRHGLEVCRVTGLDLADRGRVVARLLGARSRARWEPPQRRRWTTEPPPWWDPSPTVEDLINEREARRLMLEDLERLSREQGPLG
jgi:hypothetical protein